MSRSGVEQVIGRLLIDPEFRQSVRADPARTLEGFDLTEEERDAITRGDHADFEAAANALDERLSKMPRLY